VARRRRSRTRERRIGWPTFVVLALVVLAVTVALRDGAGGSDRMRGTAGDLRDGLAAAVRGALDGADPTPGPGPADAGDGQSLGALETGLTPQQAAAALADLTVGPATLPGTDDYDRDDYGDRWQDVDGNGCNQRDDVLLRDALPGSAVVQEQGPCPHDVTAGSWEEPYTGTRLTFDDLKDPEQAQALSIDHVVPLAEAHRSGASAWSEERRTEFANDLDGLVVADGAVNSDKGDSDPSRWRPPDEAAWCAYAVAWIDVKATWSLSVDTDEVAALEDMLERC
jgi:hypothetical protein